MELEIIHGAINLRIGRKRVLCLGNTNRIMSDSHFLNQLDAVAGDAAVRNDAGSIKVGSHFLYFLLYTVFFFIRITQRFGRIIFYRIDYEAGHIYRSFTTFAERIIDGVTYTQLFAVLAQHFHFLVRVGGKLIESNYYRLSERAKITNMFIQIAQSFFQSFHVRFLDAVEADTTVHLQSLCRSDNHGQFRLESAFAAFDVIELFSTEVCAESGFRDHIVTE